MTPLPRIIAHRGASSLAPENTIAAFAKAMEVGARWFEFDVGVIGDGSLIVIHAGPDYDRFGRLRRPRLLRHPQAGRGALVLRHVPFRACSRGR